MLTRMSSPAFKEKGVVRPPIKFREGLNVVLGKADGAMSIGKSSALLAIDFVFGGDTYIKSDGVKKEGDHFIYSEFTFEGEKYWFARNTGDADRIYICNENNEFTGDTYTKAEFTNWLKKQYKIDFVGLSFRTVLSSFFRIYGKDNTDERRPLRGIPGQDMEKSINMLLTIFNRYGEIEEFKSNVTEHSNRLKAYRDARKYSFISNLVGGKTKYEENQAKIRELEWELGNLTEEAEKGHSEEEIEKNKQKASLNTLKLNLESQLQAKERKLRLVDMSLEYGLYPTEADLSALQEFFPEVDVRKIYEVEKYHRKLAKILDGQFADERGTIQGEINELQTQKQAYMTLKELQEAKSKAEDVLKRSIEDILIDIETELNDKMKEFNDSLFKTHHKPPHIKFNKHDSYKFETPDDTGTGSNFKGMIVYDLAVLFSTALPAIAHDSLLFKNLGKDVEDGIFQIYCSTNKQVFIAYDKQDDCRTETQKILESKSVLRLSDGNCELYGRSWNKEEQD